MRSLLARAAPIAVAACITPSTVAQDVILEWNQQILQSIRESDGIPNGYPGPLSRCIAMVYTSIYDAVNSVSPTHEPYLEIENCPPGTSAEAAAATAAYHAISAAFQFAPLQQPKFDALYATQMARIRNGRAKAQGIALGTSCADAIIKLRTGDHSDEPIVYVPGTDLGQWSPTWPDGLAAATPHWPLVTPWCLKFGSQFRPVDGCAGFTDLTTMLESPEYAAQLNEVKEIGALFSATRTDYESETAFFWANCRSGTYKPAGHQLHIAQVLAEDHNLTLAEEARLFALTAVAMADAFIASWDTKYSGEIDLWRPIAAIWQADADGNPLTAADPTWLSYSFSPEYGAQGAFTPPFPAWTSGHATLGAATAAVWKSYFGTDLVTFTITSDDRPGVWRTYTNFTDAALENGRSRVLFGVHFQWDCDFGYDLGTQVGDYVAASLFHRLGDLDGNDVVDAADLALLLGNWSGEGIGDINKDGTVDGADLAMLLGNWG